MDRHAHTSIERSNRLFLQSRDNIGERMTGLSVFTGDSFILRLLAFPSLERIPPVIIASISPGSKLLLNLEVA